MCDPITIIAAISAVTGAAGVVQASNAPKPPGPKANDTAEAIEDTGADIALGGEETAITEEPSTGGVKKKKAAKSGSTISGAKKTGISIL